MRWQLCGSLYHLRRWRGGQRLLWLVHSQDPSRSGGGPANCSSAHCHGMGQIKNNSSPSSEWGQSSFWDQVTGSLVFVFCQENQERQEGREENAISQDYCAWSSGYQGLSLKRCLNPLSLHGFRLTGFQCAPPGLFPCGLLLPWFSRLCEPQRVLPTAPDAHGVGVS